MDQENWDHVKKYFSAAVELDAAGREEILASITDDAVRAEVGALLSAHENSADFINEPVAVERGFIGAEEDKMAGTYVDEYLLVRRIGSGGMGSVYLAEHSGREFTQRVALKVIKRGMDTESVLARFYKERQILARLEHPFIARMLDGGSTAEGLPYVVLEYVEGFPLREYCNKKSLDARERLLLFRKICSAIAYAHRMLVVHRDLKPSNILVSEDGEPKVVDFGIAKILDPTEEGFEAEVTATRFRVLTPEYASPEQLKGGVVTTATDVYSLGVVLYELLTGVRPYETKGKGPGETLSGKPLRDPPRPSTASGGSRRTDPLTGIETVSPVDSSELRGDLDNIVLKAIRPEPERRYQTVDEFSKDIGRYLSGLPVLATGDARSYRFAKFYRRNKTAVLGAGLVSALLLGSAVFSTWQYVVAERQREVAERRLADVRGLARTIIFDHYERIKNLPGATEAREKLISDALEYLDKLAEDSNGDKALQRELVAGYSTLAEIQFGMKDAGSLGLPKAARENFLKALAIQESLAGSPDSPVEDVRVLANLYLDATEIFVEPGEREQRTRYVSRGYDLLKGLAERNPDKKQARVDVARSLWFMANDVRSHGDNKEAIRYFNEAIALYGELLKDYPEDTRIKRNLALSLKNVGSVYSLEKRYGEALENFRKALAIDARSAEQAPNDVGAQMDLSFSHASLGSAYKNLNDTESSISAYSKALSIQEGLYEKDPKNMFVKQSLFRSRATLADNLRDARRFAEAEAAYEGALALAGSMDAASLRPLERGRVAGARFGFGLLFELKAGNSSGMRRLALLRTSESHIRSSVEEYTKLKSEGALDPSFESVKKDAELALSRVRDSIGRPRS